MQVIESHFNKSDVAVMCGVPHLQREQAGGDVVARRREEGVSVVHLGHRSPGRGPQLEEAFLKPEALQRYVGVMDCITRRHFDELWEAQRETLVFPTVKR
ncbi:hypothetical protein V2J09_005704 [Rumex salicifolius]